MNYLLYKQYDGERLDNTKVSLNQFKQYVDEKLKDTIGGENRSLLFWINTEDDVITKMEMQYTP